MLVADDDVSTREAVVAMLEELGYDSIRTASNGQEALAALGEQPADILMLDLMMPRVDGFDVLRELRAGAIRKPGRVVVMSAHADPAERASLQALGADTFLAKPFSLTQLQAALAHASA